ncbi:hypothetical protein IFM89_009301 [Coptis chinensis]|uniref:E3 ubiquitin-protein ligase n=1 Tax=Coptis chinensis TaxID=261450 RepID=A0A835MAG8_9MAGN|nr:hypothetical protein IFM89_009301 [Coptis chinensis]
MELDSFSPQDRILQRLHQCGVGEEQLNKHESGVVEFVKENRFLLSEAVYAILPNKDDLLEAYLEANEIDGKVKISERMKDELHVSIDWLKWLMFEDEPVESLKNLGKSSVGQRGVCGAVWGSKDIAYRCRTCENDYTCAICVTCFQNGNHKDHDYSLMYTGGGCCDCGDVTAWKREGFCSRHTGSEQIRPLSEEIANTVGPVLDLLFGYWKEKLVDTQNADGGIVGENYECVMVSKELTATVVRMLLEFCMISESLLSFVSKRVFSCVGLLDVLVRAECFMGKNKGKKLHEVLLKLLGEPTFKYEFAKVFINYYPDVIKEAIEKSSDAVLQKYSLLSTFSVQIFTVPTLTPRLVKEMGLLDILLGCLGDIFYHCTGEEGHLQIGKWASLYETTLRLVEDTRYVMSHAEVSEYVTCEQPDISRIWIRLLAFVQGMNPQKRIMDIHVEEENEHSHMPFGLGRSTANVNSLLVAGAFSGGMKDVIDNSCGVRHAKVGKLSEESSVCSTTGRSGALDGEFQVGEVSYEFGNHLSVPSSVMRLILECLRALENWLGFNCVLRDPKIFSSQETSSNASNYLGLKKTICKSRKGKSISKLYQTSSAKTRLGASTELHDGGQSLLRAQNTNLMATNDMDVGYAHTGCVPDESIMETDSWNESEALGVLSLSDWPDIVYNVSSQDISVHSPLHRLLATLLEKVLNRCYGASKALDVMNPVSDFPSSGCSHDFFGWLLGGCHPFGFSGFLMEHPLRTRVFCAQVRAGMWRKNGDSAVIIYEWYRLARWSEQGLELDLFLLQFCAALAPPDLYVKRLLDRFGLSSYLSLSLERSNEYEPIIMQEMLTLIIQIVKERRFCGLSTVETLRRELIYKLAIGDATRSQLMKSLPHGLSKNDQLQKTLDTVAVYANPSEMKQGKYSLQKAYWDELDLYHLRWNSRDLQIAEERYLRFCKVSALTGQLPRWTNVFHPLSGISAIATCETVLKIVRAVLFYAVSSDNQSSSRAPDGVLVTTLHLLSLSLDILQVQRKSSEQSCSASHSMEGSHHLMALAGEEVDLGATNRSGACKPQSLLSLLVSLLIKHRKESVRSFSESGQSDLSDMIENLLKTFAELDVGCMTKLKTLAPEVVGHMFPAIDNSDIHMSGSTSSVGDLKAKARERQAAIMEKMRVAQSKFMANVKSTSNMVVNDSTSKQELYMSDEEHVSEEPLVCSLCRDPDSKSPLSFMVLLQKSRLTTFVERGPPSWEQAYILDKLVQNAADESTNDGLPGEVYAFMNFIKARLPPARNIQLPSTSQDESMDTESIETLEDNIYRSIQREMQCILLHPNVLEDYLNNSMLPAKDLNDSTELVLLKKYVASLSEQPSVSKDGNASHESSVPLPSFDGFGPTNGDGIYISSCGHAVHLECRDRYISSLRERYNRRIGFEGVHVVDPDKGEFLCPVCRRLANAVLPTVPGDSNQVWKQRMMSGPSSEVLPDFSTKLGAHALRLPQALSLLLSGANVVGKGEVLQVFSLLQSQQRQPTLEPAFRRLCRMYFPDTCDGFSESGRVSHSLVFWDTLRYSLIATEIAARGGRSTLSTGGPVSGAGALYRELESSSGFILSLLLQVVQSTRSENCPQVLLRLRGIQLFKESICSAVSVDQSSIGTSTQRGNTSLVLKHTEKDILYPDIQFWRRAANPVLAHDPFSSMMWILFSLPRPFLSSVDSFFCLVHLFYCVCVIQALITCCGQNQLDITKLGSGHCLIDNVCKIKAGSVAAQKYFVSHYVDSSCHPKDVIRIFAHPYLRRCALLWKLLKSSTSGPFCDRSHQQWDMSFHMNNDISESNADLFMELKEVEELENIFQIPDLAVILNDKKFSALSLKWFHHFCKDYEVRSYGRVLHSTPAVPFRLMCLPHVYQDLLERYIKQQCPNPQCKKVLPNPALCLLCGRVCSPRLKTCCREMEGEGGCHEHAKFCGAGIGVFLLIRSLLNVMLIHPLLSFVACLIFYFHFSLQDVDLQRGKPLFLNEERYVALAHMVATHGLDQSSEVLRQTTMESLFMI